MRNIKWPGMIALLAIIAFVTTFNYGGCGGGGGRGGGGDGSGSSGFSLWSKASAGGESTLAIKNNGTLWAWGDNNYGQLGDGTSNSSLYTPVQVLPGTTWATVASSPSMIYGHTVAIKSDGTLWACGSNYYGQLGDGSYTDKNPPVQIGTAKNWTAIATGDGHTLALSTTGTATTLWAWGKNYSGQLGDGTGVDRIVPTKIGTSTNWMAIATGSYHSVALKSDGTLWAWGNNTSGELGDGTYTVRASPTKIGTATNWSKIACGERHTLAIKTDGTLWAWGLNDDGQLGDGTTVGKIVPTKIGTATNWSKVAAGPGSFTGGPHSAGIRTDGSLWTWGNNDDGKLGDGTEINRSTPTRIGTATNWADVSCGIYHTIGRKTDGTLWGWGNSINGQLGTGNDIYALLGSLTPIQIGR
ncbi:MAG: hypothetical protein QME51_07810 [Planctomycetota bacterium]|nr:hypothetical protein [Planctomycetota bacterium]